MSVSPSPLDRALEALHAERAPVAAQLERIDQAIAALQRVREPALPFEAAPPPPPCRAGRARAPKPVPTPHDKAVAKRRTTAPAKMAAPGSAAKGANAALRDRLRTLVLSAGASGVGAPALAKQCGVSRVTALRQLKHLEVAGVIHMTGWSRSARWFVGPKKARGLQRS